MAIQTSIATEMSLYDRVVQTAQPFLAADPTGTMGLLAGFQVLDRASRRPVYLYCCVKCDLYCHIVLCSYVVLMKGPEGCGAHRCSLCLAAGVA
jgi:hypothetical protein